MTYVVGLDPSLTAAGVAAIAHPDIAPTPNVPRVRTVGERGSDEDTLLDTTRRLERQRVAILRAMPARVALVVIEHLGVPNPKAPGRFRERAVLAGGIESFLAARSIPFCEVAPGTLKLWAAGSGSAAKAEVHDAMVALWPSADLWTVRGHCNDNASDALALASMGAQHLGWYPPELPHHFEPRVRWPAGLRTEVRQ